MTRSGISRIAVPMSVAALGLLAFGCGGSDDDGPDAVSLPTVTAPAVPQTQAPTGTTSPGSAQVKQPNGTPAPSAAAQSSPSSYCPPSLSKRQCRALAEGGTGSTVSDSDGCPAGISRRRCRELYQEIKQGNGSRPGSIDCTQLGPELCDQLRELGE